MKIALVSPGYPPALGGIEVVVAQLARALSRAGHSVEVFAQERRPELVGVSADGGVVVRRFASRGPHNYPVAPELWRALATHTSGFDVVHGHSYHTLTGTATALRSRAPFVFSPHYHGTGHSPLRAVLHKVYRPAGRIAFTRASAVVCVSQVEADLVTAHFPEAATKTAVIPNAVDIAAIRRAEPWPGEPPTVLSVGRLERYKRVDRAIAALAAASDLPFQLVVIGDGPDRSRLEELARRVSAPGRIRFLGRVPDSELHRWLRTCRVLCSMSEHEAFGLAPTEALAAGARVVLSRIPAHVELAATAGASVELVDSDATADVLADHLIAALPPLRPPRRPHSVSDWDDVASRFSEIYSQVARDRTGIAS
jgi:glycosyltransferase involved in cell wall biosynthesis